MNTNASSPASQAHSTANFNVVSLDIPSPFPATAIEAAELYIAQGVTVFPLYSPGTGTGEQNGKIPAVKDYRQLRTDWATEADKKKYWGGTPAYNMAILLPPGHVVVDLDSKADEGSSVVQWLEAQASLPATLQVKTLGGRHLYFRCEDLPVLTKSDGTPRGTPLVSLINAAVTAELMLPGMHITAPPSRRQRGFVYAWQGSGQPTVISWKTLQDVFGFKEPASGHTSGSRAACDWEKLQSCHAGDLQSLDVVKLFTKAGIYGGCISSSEGKHSVKCPFSEEHSDHGDGWSAADTSAVIYEPNEGRRPAFDCKHAHCQGRKLLEVIERFDLSNPGLVDSCCAEPHRPKVILPGEGQTQSMFVRSVAEVMAKAETYFLLGDEVVEVSHLPGNGHQRRLRPLTPRDAITSAEQVVQLGIYKPSRGGDVRFVPKSMNAETAAILLESQQLRQRLPQIRRMLRVPIPVFSDDGSIVLPRHGYDEKHQTFLDLSAPKINSLCFEEAIQTLDELFGDADSGGFPWHDHHAKTAAIARVLTPFCRGLMEWEKAPVFLMFANQPRLGKDTIAMLVSMLYTRDRSVGPPLEKQADAEMKKRITSALRTGNPFIHFANLRGYVNFPSLEAATDASVVWKDRLLGHSSELTLPNEAEYSLSMNLGATLTSDLDKRSVIIRLRYAGENPNLRTFRHPDLLNWVRRNESRILGALHALVLRWNEMGRPAGPTPFASFQRWSRIVGGIMTACDLGDPCVRPPDLKAQIGDRETEYMRMIFILVHETHGHAYIKKDRLYILMRRGEEWPFPYLKLDNRDDQTKLGMILERYRDRELSGITMRIDDSDKKRKRYAFIRRQDGDASRTGGPDVQTSQTLQTCNLGQSCPSGGDSNFSAPPGTATPENLHGQTDEKVCNVCNVPTAVGGFTKITTSDGLHDVLVALAAHPDAEVCLDIETYGKNPGDALAPRKGSIRLLQLAVEMHVYVIDVRAVGDDVRPVLASLASRLLIGHNLVFDLSFLARHFDFKASSVFCTMTASRTLGAGDLDQKHDLGAVMDRMLNVELKKEHGASDWSGVLSEEQWQYAANDVAQLARLRSELLLNLKDADLDRTADLEMNTVLVTVALQRNGIALDVPRVSALRDKLVIQHGDSIAALRRMAGNMFNPNSPDQVLEALSARGHLVSDTKEDTLSQLADPLASSIIETRQIKKQIESCDALLDRVEVDGRVHARFDPMQARTGRFSSKEPNMQNIPRGELRTCIKARAGYKLIGADYSQIELRVAAVISGEERMLEAYRKGADLHVQTAALVLGKEISSISKDERQLAKAVNFGMLFGQKAKGLVGYARSNYGVHLDESRAADIRQAFLLAYPDLDSWQRKQADAANHVCEARTVIGRRRRLPSGPDSWWMRYSALLNTPVQGSAADGLKCALWRLYNELPQDCYLVSCIHDEILVEAPEERAQEIKTMVEQIMVAEMHSLFPDVPIEVEAKVFETWGDK
ncbi:DNA polymerase [Prosthecobacter sp.]|uniref:DNA polymerase n=1 Tax=Prosthecobacter sp. TaxID=1965333 RepID=UPI003783996A